MDRPKVWIDKGRMLIVDGKRFFPIGARHVPEGASPALLKQAGFNCIRWLPFPNETIAPADIDEIRQAGIMYYPYIFNRGDLSRDRGKRMADLEKLVGKVSGDSLMLCYEQQNEPSYIYRNWAERKVDPAGMKEGSDHLRSIDPDHPIRLGHGVFNLVSTLKLYNPSADIIGCNPYVICPAGMRPNCATRMDGRVSDSPNQTLSAVGDYTSKMMHTAEGRPVWMQLQACANEDWYNEELYTPELKGQGKHANDRLFPNHHQMRFMAFHSIIRGATAMEWAMYGLSVKDPAWIDIKRTVSELASLHDVLCAPDHGIEPAIEYIEHGTGDWTGIETLTKEHENTLVVIAANTQFDPMEAFISFGNGVSVKVFFEPYEVKVLYI